MQLRFLWNKNIWEITFQGLLNVFMNFHFVWVILKTTHFWQHLKRTRSNPIWFFVCIFFMKTRSATSKKCCQLGAIKTYAMVSPSLFPISNHESWYFDYFQLFHISFYLKNQFVISESKIQIHSFNINTIKFTNFSSNSQFVNSFLPCSCLK